MSSASAAFPRPNVTVTGRLRLANLSGQHRMSLIVREAGFADISWASCLIFRFEGPEGRRPSELASSVQMSKQAVNDCLRLLEDRGYLTRTSAPEDRRARIIRLTAKGERLQEVVRAAGRQVEQEWTEAIGEPDWSAFTRVLDRLAAAALHADDDPR